jgi:hypothetical protein
MQSVGWPDFYVADVVCGQFWIEFKVWPNHIDLQKNLRQKQRIEDMRKKGVDVYIATYYPETEEIIIDDGEVKLKFDWCGSLNECGKKVREYLRGDRGSTAK